MCSFELMYFYDQRPKLNCAKLLRYYSGFYYLEQNFYFQTLTKSTSFER